MTVILKLLDLLLGFAKAGRWHITVSLLVLGVAGLGYAGKEYIDAEIAERHSEAIGKINEISNSQAQVVGTMNGVKEVMSIMVDDLKAVKKNSEEANKTILELYKNALEQERARRSNGA